jgi:hypothetical protein
MSGRMVAAAFCAGLGASTASWGADAEPAHGRESPWLFVPIISSNPKLGTSGGLLGAYLHRFDPQSTVSMFGAAGIYTTTHSALGGVFARTYFGEDRHRLIAFAGGGHVYNNYEDFLGSGVPVSTEGNAHVLAARYLYRVRAPWFLGVQAVDTNYLIFGENALSGEILERIGLTGFDSVGAGLVVTYDSRDDQNSPSSGFFGDANNVAYRESLGGEADFDVYRLTLKQYFPHGRGSVLLWALSNRWTRDAPPAGYSTLNLRGYVGGQYLGENMSSFQVEDRIRMGPRWGFAVFAGVACLYGGRESCGNAKDVYWSGGGGLYYVLKQRDKMVATLEYADGEGANRGLYMRFGWGL